MSISVTLRGRLGNNLFQYALGRTIAEHLRLALDCHALPLPPSHPARELNLSGAATLHELISWFPEAPLCVEGVRVRVPVDAYELTEPPTWRGQSIPFRNIMTDRQPRHIRLHGYFQRFEYYQDNLRAINHWFQLGPAAGRPPIGPAGKADVALSIRRGLDFATFGWILPLSYYDGILRRLSRVGQLFICGTGIDDVIKEHFRSYSPVYVDGTPLDQFRFIQGCERIVLSNSTFAWWAAFLSGATVIYGPHASYDSGYAFTGFRDVDLHMRQQRYQPVNVDRFAQTEWRLRSHIVDARLFTDGECVLVVRRDGAQVARVPPPCCRETLLTLTAAEHVDVSVITKRYSPDTTRMVLSQLDRYDLASAVWRCVE